MITCSRCTPRSILAILTIVLAASVAHAQTIHVPGDFPTIQQAITAAGEGGHILIAPGMYNEAIDLLGKSLVIEGENGSEATVLTAVGLDSPVVIVSGEHATVELRGLSVTGGQGAGGGLVVTGATFSAAGCDFFDNSSTDSGGAVRVIGGAGATFTNCNFTANSALSYGGAVFISSNSPSVFQACHFATNEAESGGAMSIQSSNSCTVDDCTFENNSAHEVGGALHVRISGQGTAIRNCSFEDNAASFGGAAYFRHLNWLSSYSPIEVRDCTFKDNHVDRLGGALYLAQEARLAITNCVFDSNFALDDHGPLPTSARGGAIFAATTSHTHTDIPTEVVDCLFVDNVSYRGGAIYQSEYHRLYLLHSSFIGNVSRTDAGALRLNRATINNCMIADNHAGGSGGGLYFDAAGNAVMNTTISGNSASIAGGIFSEYPPTVQNVIFCDNAPDEIVGPYTDNGGNMMLADCKLPQVTWHVPADFQTIQAAIDASQHGDEILVGPGIYTEAIDMHGKRIAILATAGPEATTIDASGTLARTVTSGLTAIGASLEGFTLLGGRGGVQLDSSASLRIANCVLRGHSTSSGGGGIKAASGLYNPGNLEVINCTIEDNHSPSGGGVMISHTNAMFRSSRFLGNTASNFGGAVVGIVQQSARSIFIDCQFHHNSADAGGGIWTTGETHVSACEFRFNTATEGGAIAAHPNHQTTVSDSLFCANLADHINGPFTDLGGNDFLDECPVDCLGDITGDRVVDVADLLALVSAWGGCASGPGCAGDLNQDAAVDIDDLLLLLAAWGVCR